nr:uncharacterized protein CI109_006274 [Kwoniella shandongensis]KAA5525375.1 hypothetical protein CI109_006274 [Kwoniella shandongensis]
MPRQSRNQSSADAGAQEDHQTLQVWPPIKELEFDVRNLDVAVKYPSHSSLSVNLSAETTAGGAAGDIGVRTA